MVGREIKDLFPKPEVKLGDEMLKVEIFPEQVISKMYLLKFVQVKSLDLPVW